MLNPRTSHLEGAKFDATRKGIVQIRRIRTVSKYQRSTKQHQRHDLKFSDCTVNGAVYEYMMTGPNGLADALEKYYNHDEDVDEDEDQNRTTAWGIPIELTSEQQSKKGATLSFSLAATESATSAPNPDLPLIRVQQDNAGGHGFNNRQVGKPTENQRRMVETMKKRGYCVYSQPRNSPEFNMLDLGFWNSLKVAIRQRTSEIQSWQDQPMP